MQTFFLVADDIMDGAETRRGKQCWYKKDNIGMMAFNDAIILETCIYSVLSRHLKHHKHYNTFVDAFLQVNLLTLTMLVQKGPMALLLILTQQILYI